EVAHIISGGEYQGIEAAQFSRGQIIRHIVQAQEFQLGQWRAGAAHYENIHRYLRFSDRGAIRFSELRRRTAPISQKMLTQTLPAKRSIAPCPGRRCITAPGMPPDRQRRYRQHGA
ncbi:MAG: hypothetical protein KBG29_16205, partial [Pseudomonadales bacterium]|nr:hypothetical protein [Pseudomonadales bacterium]